ncbi:MAG: ABC transporter permease [Spirochaetales bacterium]|nr:ABC transporter permease [Spirochaetales bacterium]
MSAQQQAIAAKPISVTNLFSLALLNLKRHGVRAVVNITGIAVTVAALVFFLSFYRGTYEGVMFSSVIDYSTAHGQFMAMSFDDDDPESWLDGPNLIDEALSDEQSLTAAARNAAGGKQTVTTPRLMSPAFAGDGSRKAPIVLIGAEYGREKRIFSLDDRMLKGGFEDGGIVIGKKLADALSLGMGDEMRVQASTSDGAPNLDYWVIAGIYSTGYPEMDRSIAFISLADAQSFLSADGKINKIYCRIAENNDSIAREGGIAAILADETVLEGKGLVFKSWKSYAAGIVEDAKKDGQFFAVFILILVFLSFSTMAGTMRVTVYERRREIGMLRASGWLRGEIAALFLIEAFLIGAAGSVAGCGLGGPFSFALKLNPISFGTAMSNLNIPNFSLACDPQFADFAWAAATGFLTAVLAGLSPAIKGARMPILDAIAER